ncbi:hypothetical protein NT6N_27030 [Oceaniferula spumae]|uniref:Tetratricopeptide repeat protein n=1 Tax=Oceaniferula spumae TaxID=2979115 RepID=A0AAT9FNZ3_9BACT
MNNPYKNSRLRRLKRKSKLRYCIALLVGLPKFIVWLISLLIPRRATAKLMKWLSVLLMPFKRFVEFPRLWLSTRPWKLLLWALPLIATFAWVLSNTFLANNQTDDQKFGDYRKSLLSAAGTGDYEKAEFMSGKLFMSKAFGRDAQLLFAAMIAANENGNMPRRNVLLDRLTKELSYAPAHVWYARWLLSTGGGSNESFSQAIGHMNAAVKSSERPDDVRVQLASMYSQSGRQQKAIEILKEISDPDPPVLLMLSKTYLMVDDKDSAADVAVKLKNQLLLDDPEHKRFIPERIELYSILIDLPGAYDGVEESLGKLAESLERRVALNPKDEKLQGQLAMTNLVMANALLDKYDSNQRHKALRYLEKAMSNDQVAYAVSRVIHSLTELSASGSLSDVKIRAALADGEGVSVAHLLLGLSAWEKNLANEAKLHFDLAFSLEPASLMIAEYCALISAGSASAENAGAFRFSIQNEPIWNRSLRLLDLLQEIDESSMERNLHVRCLILADQQQWSTILDLLEPRLDSATEKYRPIFLRLLANAAYQAGNTKLAERYRNLLKEELEQQK